MARLTYAPLALALTLPLALTACGKNTSSNPDAPVVITTDAPPPIDAMPDALVCTAPQKDCGTGVCIDTSSDEQNCGDCNTVCQGGAFCKPQPDGCTCPGNFLGTDIPSSVLDVHQTQQPISGVNVHIAAAPLPDGGQVNALVFLAITNGGSGFPDIDTDYTLKKGLSFTQPNVLAAYNAQLGGAIPTADAEYEATAGTLRFSTATCDTTGFEFKGTITDATFSGATFSGMNITIDPNGCTFQIPSLTFDINVPAAAGGACTP